MSNLLRSEVTGRAWLRFGEIVCLVRGKSGLWTSFVRGPLIKEMVFDW